MDLSRLTVCQLKDICRQNNYSGWSKLRKNELISFITSKMKPKNFRPLPKLRKTYRPLPKLRQPALHTPGIKKWADIYQERDSDLMQKALAASKLLDSLSIAPPPPSSPPPITDPDEFKKYVRALKIREQAHRMR